MGKSNLVYDPERDGSIHKYVEAYNNFCSNPIFRGYKDYKLLWGEHLLIPKKTIIKFPWIEGVTDTELLVLGQYYLKGNNGMDNNYRATQIFGEVPYWEAIGLNTSKINSTK